MQYGWGVVLRGRHPFLLYTLEADMPFQAGAGNGAWWIGPDDKKIRMWFLPMFGHELLHTIPRQIYDQDIASLELCVTVGLDQAVRRAFSANEVPQEVLDALTVLKVNAANFKQEVVDFILLVDRYTDPEGVPDDNGRSERGTAGHADVPA